VAEKQHGYYVQAGYRFLNGLSSLLPSSSMTGVVRLEGVDFDRATRGDALTRYTFGLNFRPVEDAVFKLDYQINQESDGLNNKTPGRAFLFSVATYF
jgi:hypothetical protein